MTFCVSTRLVARKYLVASQEMINFATEFNFVVDYGKSKDVRSTGGRYHRVGV